MKLISNRHRRSNLYYHPTYYIGKVIEFQDRSTQQMLVESVERRYDAKKCDQGHHFVGKLILNGQVTPIMVWAHIKGTWWLCESRRRRKS